MKTHLGSASIPVPPRLMLALLLLTGCALNPRPDEETPPIAESVDIGYGSVDKDHVIGSATTVRTEDQPVVHAGTLTDMLAKIPGVWVLEKPGGGFSVRIRGTNSFLGGQEPLLVIDGMLVQTGGGLSGINPSTVESITVLKDAGTTAIYGSRGANGVILITTKREQEQGT